MIVVNGVLVSRYHLVLVLVSIFHFYHHKYQSLSRNVVGELLWLNLIE